MRLLIITQKIDKNDPVLGFFHNWVFKLSQKFEKTTVICLQKGEDDLPKEIKVCSLGKELGESKIKYVVNFYKYIWQERKNYDVVFVHMNQEYVLLGGLLWKLLGKKVYLWRNHSYGNWLTRIAVLLSDKVFCTSPHSYTAQFAKTTIMPVGIDTEIFNNEERILNNEYRKRILFLSRIAPIKQPHLLIESLKILKKEGVSFSCDFYGDSLPKDQDYFDALKNKAREYGLEEQVKFGDPVRTAINPEIYNEYNIFVNLTPSGSLDKTILEAGASGCVLVILNDYFKGIFPNEMIANDDAVDVASKIKFYLGLDEETRKEVSDKIQKYVLENHSLNALIEKLCITIKR